MGFNSRLHSQFKPQQTITLTPSTPNMFPNAWKLGAGVHYLNLMVTCALTHGNGSSAVTDGLFRFIKGISLSLSDGREIIKNVTGLFWKQYQTYLYGVTPYYTTFAATTGTYYAHICIPFRMPRKHALGIDDNVLMTDKLNNIILTLTTGTLATDCLGTVGTDTAVFTCRASIEQTAGRWGGKVPLQHVLFKPLNTLDLSSSTTLQIDRAENIAVKRLWLFTADSSGTTPYSGTASNTTLASIRLRTSYDSEFDDITWSELQAINQRDFGIAAQTGVGVIDLVGDKSLFSAMPTGMPLLQLECTAGTLSTSFLHGVMEALMIPALGK